jgi:cation transport ATPase
MPVYLLFTLPGWVLALPFVIYFKNADGWRTWAILAIGTAIGPCFLLGWPLLEYGRINWRGNGAGASMALFIGFFTSLFYVLLLRHFTSKALPNARSRI